MTRMMKQYLEQTKLFTVDVVRTAPTGTDPSFQPDFGKYQAPPVAASSASDCCTRRCRRC
jgi:hypothetical protein